MLVTAATDLQKDIVESGRVRLEGEKKRKNEKFPQEFCRICSLMPVFYRDLAL